MARVLKLKELKTGMIGIVMKRRTKMCKFCDGKDFFPFYQPEYRNIKAKIKKDEDGVSWLEFQNFRMLIYNCPFCGISLRTSKMKADVINNLPFC